MLPKTRKCDLMRFYANIRKCLRRIIWHTGHTTLAPFHDIHPAKLSTAVSSSINHSNHTSDNLLSTAVLLSCIRQILLSTAVVGTIFHSSTDKGFSKAQWKCPSVKTLKIEVIKTLQRIKMERGSHIRRIHCNEPPFYRSCVHKLEGTHLCLGLSEENKQLPYPSKAH